MPPPFSAVETRFLFCYNRTGKSTLLPISGLCPDKMPEVSIFLTLRALSLIHILEQTYPHLRMVGVNCTPPQFVEHLIGEIKAGCHLPVAVYPNSGETYDPGTKTWHGSRDGLAFGDYARRWMRAGANACLLYTSPCANRVIPRRRLRRRPPVGLPARGPVSTKRAWLWILWTRATSS